MVLEKQPLPYLEWLLWSGSEPGALIIWLATVAGVTIGALFLAGIILTVLHGPNKAGDIIFDVLKSALWDLVYTSPRRVLALAWLAVQESLRRHVLVGFVVFLAILLFAGWFLDPSQTNPTRVYIDFVLTSTTYLVLLLALVLSAFSLPQDIQNRTIFTLVTKPVRPIEIVLGRTLGFAAIGTGLLAVMGLFSYFFVTRTLSHRHTLTEEDLAEVPEGPGVEPGLKHGRTGWSRGHRHEVWMGPADNLLLTEVGQHHRHLVRSVLRDGKTEYEVGPPEDLLRARVPIYGKLNFRTRGGRSSDRGVNVGNEWVYRSYIEGGTQAAALWHFKNLRQEDFPDGLTLQMTLSVFRTYKGEIDKGIAGNIKFKNPKRPEVVHTVGTFTAKEYDIYEHTVPLQFKDAEQNDVDLFKDLVGEGELIVEINCLERAQFFGMAQADLYLLERERSPLANFAKGYLGIWLQMLLITTFGVMWSTFLNGAVATLATLGTLIGGLYIDFVRDRSFGQSLGGGTLESILRIVDQAPLTGPMDDSATVSVAQWWDTIEQGPLFIVSRLLPDFSSLNDVNYVSSGFDIPWGVLATHLTMSLGYAVPVLIVGFLFFKVREVAK